MVAPNVVRLTWLGRGMEFEGGREGGPTVIIDGEGKVGPSPMVTFLLGLVACTASDIIDITGKMRLTLGAFEVRSVGERREEPPRRYTRIQLVYRIQGVAEADREKIKRAVDLSHEKYCSALHSISEDIEVETTIEFE